MKDEFKDDDYLVSELSEALHHEEQRDYARELLDYTNAMMIAESGTKSTNGYTRYQKYRGMLIRQIRGTPQGEEKPLTIWQQKRKEHVI